MKKQMMVGINHVALKVGDVDEALKFYGKLFDFEIRERLPGHIELDMGDQFLALEDDKHFDPAAHFGLVVPDKAAVRKALEQNSVNLPSKKFLDFLDPWGNRVQIVQYDQIQFSKTNPVLKGMGLDLGKTKEAVAELKAAGLA